MRAAGRTELRLRNAPTWMNAIAGIAAVRPRFRQDAVKTYGGTSGLVELVLDSVAFLFSLQATRGRANNDLIWAYHTYPSGGGCRRSLRCTATEGRVRTPPRPFGACRQTISPSGRGLPFRAETHGGWYAAHNMKENTRAVHTLLSPFGQCLFTLNLAPITHG